MLPLFQSQSSIDVIDVDMLPIPGLPLKKRNAKRPKSSTAPTNGTGPKPRLPIGSFEDIELDARCGPGGSSSVVLLDSITQRIQGPSPEHVKGWRCHDQTWNGLSRGKKRKYYWTGNRQTQ